MLYAVFLAYVALIYVRPGEIIPGWEGYPFVYVLSAIASLVAAYSYLARPRPFWSLPHDHAVLGLWMAVALSNAAWGWFGGAVMGLQMFFRPVFYYFLMRAAVRDPSQLRGLLVWLVLLNVLLAILGIDQYQRLVAEVDEAGTGGGPRSDEVLRARGTGIFGDPNDLAISLVMVAPIMIGWIVSRGTGVLRRALAITAFPVVLTAIYLTNSRGGILGLGAAVVGYAYRRFGWKWGTLLGVVSVGLIVAVGPSRLARMDAEESSAQGRVQAWAAALAMLKSSPLFGIGFDRFLEFHERVAHNSFVHCLGELGLAGTFVWTGMVYWLLKGLWPRPAAPAGGTPPGRAAVELEQLRDQLLAGAIGFLASAAFLSRTYNHVLYTLVGLGACHASICHQLHLRPRLAHTRADLRNVALLTAGGVAATWAAVRALAIWSGEG